MHALVMELVEGRICPSASLQGAIPVDEALPIAKQIAEALEAAHEQGIIHRDLKPANIKVRRDGTVKVLDFGLAKATEPIGGFVAELSMSPTITTPAMTQAGMILGTAAYMSPEQARGKAVDKRTDVWAFGCVVYEMLTGRAAFAGDTLSDTIAAILEREPDWSVLPAATPAPIRRLLLRCLDKERQAPPARHRRRAHGNRRCVERRHHAGSGDVGHRACVDIRCPDGRRARQAKPWPPRSGDGCRARGHRRCPLSCCARRRLRRFDETGSFLRKAIRLRRSWREGRLHCRPTEPRSRSWHKAAREGRCGSSRWTRSTRNR